VSLQFLADVSHPQNVFSNSFNGINKKASIVKLGIYCEHRSQYNPVISGKDTKLHVVLFHIYANNHILFMGLLWSPRKMSHLTYVHPIKPALPERTEAGERDPACHLAL
jgi:hypothetical protein